MNVLSRDDVVQMFNSAGDTAGWKPGFGNDRVIGYLEHFAVLARTDLVAENERLREQIKCGHSMELDALARERDELLVENERLLAANRDCIDHFNAAMEDLAAAQAKIDSLMLEYCQVEMTPEQIENWGKHQKAVSDQTNLPLQLSP